MPRLKYLKKVLEKSRPPIPFKPAPARPVPELAREKAARTPGPENYSKHSQKLYDQFLSSISSNLAHFPIGGKEVYFPWAPITLLRPSAKMTPYQAQFMVPRNFNKLDLRDYLWHVYGLRALGITTQIKWSKWVRTGMQRIRTPQFKKMIIEMEEPFLWPKPEKNSEIAASVRSQLAFQEFEDEMQESLGSDKHNPAKTFDGVLGPYPLPPRPFVPSHLKSQMLNAKQKAAKLEAQRQDERAMKILLKKGSTD